ncbi:hypothetical protein JCM10908_005971 [Rhodotorula pacifica]|uniref:uncharacterized protein n=1 Tax=Rhodotorula pacifica TaxID=1495444 RepID=UPI00317C37A7
MSQMSYGIEDHPLAAVNQLVALASRPPQGAYALPLRPSLVFRVSQNMSVTISDALSAWEDSLYSINGYERIPELAKWLNARREVMQRALNNHSALCFDVLVLGILPTNTILLAEKLGMPVSELPSHAPISLAQARFQLAATREEQRGVAGSGWRRQFWAVCEDVLSLQRTFNVTTDEAPAFAVWNQQAQEVFSERVHDGWNVLVQYGVRELVFFLYIQVYTLFAQNQKARAVQVLAYWTPQTILARIEKTIHAAVHCSVPVSGSGPSLEALSSARDPTYFQPLPLPPHIGFGQPRHKEDPEDLKRILSRDEPRTHGYVAQLGRRAGKHYRVDAEKWASRASTRWR